MKFVIASLVLLASIFAVQANNLKLLTFINHQEKGTIGGTVSAELVGATQTKTVEFPVKNFKSLEKIEMTTDFSENVERVYLTWKSDVKFGNIGIGSFLVYVDDKILKFETDKKRVEDTERIALLEN